MADKSQGTLLKMGDGAGPEVFTTVAEVTNIGGPSFSREAIETTNHSSPGGYRQHIPGLRDGGEVTFTVNFMPANATHDETDGMLGQFADDDIHNWRLVYPITPARHWAFAAFITKFDTKAPVGDKLSADMTLKISGAPVLEDVPAG